MTQQQTAPGVQVVVLSAAGDEQLVRYADRMARWIEQYLAEHPGDDNALERLAFTLQTGREPMRERLALVTDTLRGLAEQLSAYAADPAADHGPVRGTAMRPAPAAPMVDADPEEVAQLWLRGAAVDWRARYADRRAPTRLALPAAPPRTRSYWIEEPRDAVASVAQGTGARPNPLAAGAAPVGPDAPGLEFRVTLDGSEFFLRDHAIGPLKVLPAVAALELAAATLGNVGRGAVHRIDDVMWVRPVVVENKPVEVRLLAVPTESGFSYEVRSGADLCSAGRVGFAAPQIAAVSLDLDTIRSRCPASVDAEQCYAVFDRLGGGYGPSFQPLRGLVHGPTEVLARVEVPAAVGLPHEAFVLHPALLDGMFQAVLWAERDDSAGSGRRLPFAFQSLELLGSLPPRGYVHVVSAANGALASTDGYDLTLADEDGRIALRIRGFVEREVGEDHVLRLPQPMGAGNGASESGLDRDAGGIGLDVSAQTTGFVEVLESAPGAFDADVDLGDVLLVGAERPPVDMPGARLRFARIADRFAREPDGAWRVSPDDEAHWSAVFGDYAECGPGPSLVIWDAEAAAADEAVPHAPAIRLTALFRAWSRFRSRTSVRLLYVYRARGAVEDCAHAALDGLLRTMAREQPDFLGTVIAVPQGSAADCGRIAVREATAQHEFAVVYQRGERLVPRWHRVQDFPEAGITAPRLRGEGVYLVTGGLGGLGRIVVRHLAGANPSARFVLVGGGLPDSAREHALAELRTAGADVVYRRARLGEPGEARQLIDDIRTQFGGLNGVLHLAGTTRDAYLATADTHDEAVVFGPKVAGTLELDEATASEELDFFILFSSMSGAAGTPGQGGYAYANRFLDHFAAWRDTQRREGLRNGRTLSLLWSLWRDGGIRMATDHAAQERAASEVGLSPFTADRGINALDAALARAGEHLLIAHGRPDRLQALLDGPPRRPILRATAGASTAGTGARLADRPRAAGVSAGTDPADGPGAEGTESLQARAEAFLAPLLAEVFGIETEELETDTTFDAYGIDSVLIMDLNRRLEARLGPLPKTLFFEYRELRSLAGYFADQHPELLDAPSPAVPGSEHQPELERESEPESTPVPQDRMAEEALQEPIAIIGLSARFAGSDDMNEFWGHLRAGRDLITEIPQDRWDWRAVATGTEADRAAGQSRWGSFLDGIDRFDPLFFGISPREAEILDPQERLFLESAWHTLEDAGYTRAQLAACRTGVYVGSMYTLYQLYEASDGRIGASSQAAISNRVSYTLGFTGPSLAVDTMCSSALTAIHLAVRDLRAGVVDVALAGGVNLHVHPYKYRFLNQGGFTSSDGRCRSFGADGDGYVPGEGVGAVLLKPLSRAQRDGDHIYATILGSSVNHGGRTNGFTVPNPEVQGELIGSAIRNAGIQAQTISYIEAHGTGTALGDPIEIRGMARAFAEAGLPEGSLPIGSVKSNIGHLEAAAGMAALCKVLLQMEHGSHVPSLHSDTLNPAIDWAGTPFVVQQETEPWQPADGSPRRAGISSFGAGGANAHLVVEEYRDTPVARVATGPQLVPLSAKTPERLRELAGRLAGYLLRRPDADLAAVAWTLQTGREALDDRLAVLVSSTAELAETLQAFADGGAPLTAFWQDSVRGLSRSRGTRVAKEDVAQAVTRRDLSAIADLWVRGGDPDWRRLHLGVPARLSLPVYPFERLRCWIADESANHIEGGPGVAAGLVGPIHPLLGPVDPAASMDSGLRFGAVFAPDHELIRDHQIQGVGLLPGVAVLELARAAAAAAGLGQRPTLRDVRWLRPFTVARDEVRAWLTLRRTGRGLVFELCGQGSGETLVYSEGLVEAASQAPAELDVPMNPAEIEARCPNRIDGPGLYEDLALADLVYGPSLRSVQWLAVGDGQALARLVRPAAALPQDGLLLHPAMLDGALHTFAGLRDRDHGPAMVPYAVGAVEISGEPATACYAHVVSRKADRYDVALLDDDGEVRVMLRDLALRPARSPGSGTALPAESGCAEVVPTSAHEEDRALLDGMLFAPRWTPTEPAAVSPAGAVSGESGLTWIVYDDGSEDLASALRADSAATVSCRVEDVETLIGTPIPESIYFLAGAARPAARHDDLDDLEDSQRRGVLALFGLVKALLGRGAALSPLRLAIVTRDVLSVRGEPVGDPFAGSLHGLTQSLARECSQWRVLVLDRAGSEDPVRIAAQISMLTVRDAPTGAAQLLALRAGIEYRRKLVAVRPTPSAPMVRRDGVYLILGGAGGIGLETAEWLVRDYQARIVLVGRSSLDEGRLARLRALDPTGRRVTYERADAADAARLGELVQRIVQTHGTLNGVVHSAIVLHDQSLANMEEDTFRAALEAKTRTSTALAAAVVGVELDFVLFYSSAIALSGSAGQSNYAAGSTFEDAYAHFLGRHVEAEVRVVNWGYWGTVGIVSDARYRDRLAQQGIDSIVPAEGMAAVRHLLANDEPQLLALKAAPHVLAAAGVEDGEAAAQTQDTEAFVHGTAETVPFALINALAAEPPAAAAPAAAVTAELDRIMTDWLWQLFHEHGIFGEPDERWMPAGLAEHLGVTPAQRRLFEELLRVLVVDGRLRTGADGSLCPAAAGPSGDPEAELVALCKRTGELNRFDRLLLPCLHNLFNVLRGEMRATDVIFPNGSTALVEGAYRGSPVVDRANYLVASATRGYLELLARDSAADRALSVLEVGAGTGGTTAAVLPAAAGLGTPVRYVYTDISLAFLQHGRERFLDEYPFLEFQTLDVSRDAAQQGFEAGSFDVVIAANVLHATADLLDTLRQVKSLLRPGGWLVLNEVSRNVLTATLTFGLLDGWWLHRDAHLRLPGAPLLSAEGWEHALGLAGFARSRAIRADDDSTQCVIVAENAAVSAGPQQGSAWAHPARPAQPGGDAVVPAAQRTGGAGVSDDLRARVETLVKQAFVEILQMPADRLHPDETYENFGIDSLTMPRILDKITVVSGPLPATLLFEYPTISALVDYLVADHADALSAALPPPDRKDDRTIQATPAPAAALESPEPQTRCERRAAPELRHAEPGDTWGRFAIVGVAGRYPGARDLDEFWANLREGRDCVGEVPDDRWDWRRLTNVAGAPVSRWGGFLEGAEEFDPRFFQMTRSEAELTDPQERLFLQATWEALEDAGYPRARLRGARVGMFVGVMYGHYQLFETGNGLAGGMGYASIANRASYFFDFTGPSVAVDTMCSASLSAIHLACEALLLGDADYAVAGGVNLAVHPRKYAQLAVGGFTSSDGRCRSFGEGGDGMVPGEGVGAVLLKRLEAAERDGDRIHAVILGSALNHGGKSGGFAVPDPTAQGEVVARALRRAQVGPEAISYVEAHGTGTVLGDPIEMAGLMRAFSERPPGAPRVALGSLKSTVGHLESAAGIGAVTKVLLQMRHHELAPSLHAERLNPKIDWDRVPFALQRERAAWHPDGAGPLRAGISAFGAGGANAHLVLEEYPQLEQVCKDRGRWLIPLSARDGEQLRATAAQLRDFVDRQTAAENASEQVSELTSELCRLVGPGAGPDESLVDLGLDAVTALRMIDDVAQRRRGLPLGPLGPGRLHEQMTLRQVAARLAGVAAEPGSVAGESGLDLDRLAWTLQAGREAMSERLAFVVCDRAELVSILRRVAAGDDVGPDLHRGVVRGETWLRPAPEPIGTDQSTEALNQMARRWTEGAEFDWSGLYPHPPQPMSLPTYPFARELCRIPRGSDPAVPAARSAPAEPQSCPTLTADQADPWSDCALTSTTAERVLALTAELTGYPPEELDPLMTFHAHGLDSLSLVKLAERVSSAFDVAVAPDTLLQATTPTALAEIVDRELGDRTPGAAAGPPTPLPVRGAADVGTLSGGDPVVIVGMAGIMPKSSDLASFWENIETGDDLITEVPAGRWDWHEIYGDPAVDPGRTRVNRAGFIPDIDHFDPLFFGISPREAVWMDPRQRLLLRTVWSAIEDAGIDPAELGGTRTGLFVGVGAGEYAELIHRSGVHPDAYASTGLTPSMLANRISYHLDLRGPSEPVDTACSSSLVALHRAAEALALGHCDTVIAGGVNVLLSPVSFSALERAGMLSVNGVGRAFDKDADGYVRGEGVGVVVLKKLSRALADGNPIHAVLRGTAVNHGGRANSLTAPNPAAQAEVILAAHAAARVDPATVGFIETHGTGTLIGDPAEVSGLRQAFDQLHRNWGQPAPDAPYCALGALKNTIGHLEPAAGIAALLRAILAIHHGRVPANPNLSELNGFLRLEGSPFSAARHAQDWPSPKDAQGRPLPRRAGISSFGYGGVNAHVVIEEYLADAEPPTAQAAVFTLSARDPERLRAYAHAFATDPGWTDDLPATAYTLQVGRTGFAERMAFVARDGDEARAILSAWLDGRPAPQVRLGRVRRGHVPPVPAQDADLDTLAAAWVQGAGVDWRSTYRVVPRRRSLPTYPFAPQRYWVPETVRLLAVDPKPTTRPEPTAADLALFVTRWEPQTVPEAGAPRGTTLALCGDDTIVGLVPGDRVTVRPGAGFRRLSADAYELDPGSAEDYLRLMTGLRDSGVHVARIAYLWPLEVPGAPAIEALFLLLKAVVTVDAAALERCQVAVAESKGLAFAESWGGFAGSLRAISPGTGFSVVRFANEVDGRLLAAELAAARLDAAVVRLDATGRTVQRQREVDAAEPTGGTDGSRLRPPLRPGAVYLISGGMGGLGLLLARMLATRFQARLALLGRSALDPAKIAYLEELRALGAQAEYFECDVTDAARTTEAVAEVRRRWGVIDGVFHLAGRVSDQTLPHKELTELRAQLSVRIDGTSTLDAATAEDELDFFVLYASAAGQLGDFGLVDYGVGARYLDGFAEQRETRRVAGQRHGRTVAVDWPMWRDGGMHVDAETEARYLDQTGLRYLETVEGERVLDLALAGDFSRLMVVAGDLERVRALVRAGDAAGERDVSAGSAQLSNATLRRIAERQVRSTLSDVLAVPASSLDPDAGFGEYGLDSFGLKMLSSELSERYAAEVPTTVLFSANTITLLTTYLVENFAESLRRMHGQASAAVPDADSVSGVNGGARQQGSVTSVTYHTPAASTSPVRGAPAAEVEPIAVVGMSGRFPGSPDLVAFWRHLEEGNDLIGEVPARRWDWRAIAERFPGTPRWGGFLADVDCFDPLFFGISPYEAEVMDPQHRIFLEEAWKALEDASCRPDRLAGRPVSVFVGTQFTDYESMVLGSSEGRSANAYSGTGLARTMLANRLSYLLDLRGPSESIDTACSSSLVAVHRAVRSLRSGECELAIAGGVSLVLAPQTVISAHQLGVLAADGRCKTLDGAADGYVKGEGVAVLILKPLSRALADGDRIHGLIRGSAVNHGGHAASLTAPNPSAQTDLLKAAYHDAGVPMSTVSYLELHGTGTELGDPVEVEAIRRAYGQLSNDAPVATRVGLGTVKSNIGHLEPAAGIAGIVKVLLAMRHGRLPRTLHLKRLNPLIRLDGSPFVPVTQAMDWQPMDVTGERLPRRAGVSSFGFGGVNAHVVLEQAPETPQVADPARLGSPQLFVLSARNQERLRVYAASVAAFLAEGNTGSLASLAYTSRAGRMPMTARLAVIALEIDELRAALTRFSEAEETAADGALAGGGLLCTGNATGDESRQAWLAEPEGREYLNRILREGDLVQAARLWVDGADLDWRALPGETPPLTMLPAYPFARDRHWLDVPCPEPDKPSAPAIAPRPLVLVKGWAPAEDSAPRSTAAPPIGPLLVLAGPGDTTLAHDLCGPDDVVATLSEAEDADAETGIRLAARLLDGPIRFRCVVDLVDSAAQPCSRAPASWARVTLLQELMARYRAEGLHYLHFTRSLATFAAGRPTLRGAVLAGLVRMLSAEYRAVIARTVDADDDAFGDADRLRVVIAREIAASPTETEACLRSGARYRPVLQPVAGEAADPTFWSRDLAGQAVVITGGTGALGRAIAARLAERGADRLVMLGRRPLPPRQQWPQLAESPGPDGETAQRLRALLDLEQHGARVRVATGRLDDRAWLRSVLATVRAEDGPIAGVVHCAGLGLTTNPAFIGKPTEELRAVLEPKVAGLQELAEACADDPLRFFILCSSVSGQIPTLAAGLSDYAMANAFLDRFAEYQAATGRAYYRSLQWPSWQSMGMPEVTTNAYLDLGLRSLPTPVGLDLLDQAMAVPDRAAVMPCIAVPDVIVPGSLLTVPGPRDGARGAGRVASAAVTQDQAAVMPARTASLLARLTEVFARQLRLDPTVLTPDANFADLGVDSVMIAQLLPAVEREAGIPIEPEAFLGNPTLRLLTDHLLVAGPLARNTPVTDSGPVRSAGLPPAAVVCSRPESATPDPPAPPPAMPIAVIGLACHFPGAADHRAFWGNLVAGVDSITEVPATRWDVERLFSAHPAPGRSISRWGGFLDGIELFDPGFFRIDEAQAPLHDPLIRQFLEVSAECLADAGYVQGAFAGGRVGVFAGARTANFGAYHAATGGSISGMAQNFVAAHVAQYLDVHGPNLVIDSACSSALVAVHMAAQSLRLGECDAALAGGVEILLDEVPFIGLSSGGVLSPTGRCRAFDEQADGIVLGEGAGVVLLKRLDDALRDGDRIDALIEGGAVNNDGRSMGITTPNPDAQRAVIAAALRAADVSAAQLSYIEAHGTGTAIGDPMELRALTDVLREATGEVGFCGVGSVKTNIGHLLSAAGVAGLIKVILALRHGALPPTLHCAKVNPRFRFEDSPLFPVQGLQAWPERGGVHRAGVSSFGFGGTNAHLILAQPDLATLPERTARRTPLDPVRYQRRRYWFPAPARPTAETSPPTGSPAAPFLELCFPGSEL